MNSSTSQGNLYDFTVLLITYKQENYIEEAIESILAQEFHSPIQIVIGLDKSPDNTAAICERYANQYPNIELIAHDTNVGMFENFYLSFKHCKGKYIALLEGDDYWTDTSKLIQQFNYFEKHPDCILSAGFARTYNQNTQKFKYPRLKFFSKGIRYNKGDIILSNRFATLTTAFRASAMNWEKFKSLRGSPHLDWPMYLALNFSANSFAYKFNKVFGTYRMHESGVYSQISATKKLVNTAKTLTFIHKITEETEYKSHIQALYTNFLNSSKDTENDRNEFYKAELEIYKDGKLKDSFLRGLRSYSKAYLFKLPNFDFKFKALLSLIHQTKASYRVYLQFLTSPYLLLAVMKYWTLKSIRSIKYND